MRERKARLHEQLARLLQRQLQRDCKGEGRGLRGPVQPVRAYLGEQLPVYIRLLVALSVGHAALVYFPEQHFRKALVQAVQGVLKRTGWSGGAADLHGHPVPALPRVSAGVDVVVVYVFLEVGKEPAAYLPGPFVVNDEVHRQLVLHQEGADAVHGYPQGLVLRETEGAGGYEREGHGVAAPARGQLEAVQVAGPEALSLARRTALPARADGVYDVFAGQPVAARQLRLADAAAAELSAFLQQPRPRRAADRAVSAAVAREVRVGGVHDCVHAHFCYVVSDYLQRHSPPSPVFFTAPWLFAASSPSAPS